MAIDPRTVLALLGNNATAKGQAPAPQIDPNAQAAASPPAGGPPAASAQSTPLQGNGGGIDDLIPAHVQNMDGSASAAKLSPGEFVWPAAAVAYMGDGDNNFGAKLLDAAKTDPKLLDKLKSVMRDHVQSQTQAK